MSLRMRGISGELRKGYQVAAQLGPWSMDGGRVEAATVVVDKFWIDSPGGWALSLRLGKKSWVWRQVDVLDVGPPMVLRVAGSPTVRD